MLLQLSLSRHRGVKTCPNGQGHGVPCVHLGSEVQFVSGGNLSFWKAPWCVCLSWRWVRTYCLSVLEIREDTGPCPFVWGPRD